jgi:hypothetical protein
LLYVVPQEEQDRWHCQSSARAKHANAPTPHIRKLGCNAIQELAKKIGAVAHMYEEGYLAREDQISTPTRKKELLYLRKYILPRWGALSRPSVPVLLASVAFGNGSTERILDRRHSHFLLMSVGGSTTVLDAARFIPAATRAVRNVLRGNSSDPRSSIN